MHHLSPVRWWAKMQDAVKHGVAEIQVAGSHVYPGPQDPCPIIKLPDPHPTKQLQILLNAPLSKRAGNARLSECPSMLANLVLGEVAYVGQTNLDQMYGELVKLLEVVGGVVEVFAPIETQPAQVFLDGADVLFIFLGGIRVVEAQMAGAAIIPQRCRS